MIRITHLIIIIKREIVNNVILIITKFLQLNIDQLNYTFLIVIVYLGLIANYLAGHFYLNLPVAFGKIYDASS